MGGIDDHSQFVHLCHHFFAERLESSHMPVSYTHLVSRGLRAPIIREGDDLSQIVVDTVMEAVNTGEFTVQDRDILAVTESILARSQANYASKDQIAADVRKKLRCV